MNHQQTDFFSDPVGWHQVITIQKSSSGEPKQPEPQVALSRIEDIVHQNQSGSSSSQQYNYYAFFRRNLQSYPYSRGYHYFFDLSTFERDQQSKSYLRDPTNAFKSTYSKDQKIIGGSKVRDIINREYFTCPLREQGSSRSSRVRNPSHTALFQTEDKKIIFDRLIVTCRQILNNFEQLFSTGKIYCFIWLYKDRKLQEIFNPNLNLSAKRQIVINRLQGLLQSKRLSQRQLLAQDNINMSSSLNQSNYEQVKSKMLMFERSRVVASLYSNHFYLKELIKQSTNEQLSRFIRKVFTYYRQEQQALLNDNIKYLVDNFKSKIMQQTHQHSAVIFPTLLLSFAEPKILKITNEILGKRLSIKSKYEGYLLNTLCKRLFNISLPIVDDYQIQDQYTYKCDASRSLSKIRKFRQDTSKENPQLQKISHLLDEQINYGDLLTSPNEVFILKRKPSIQISGIEYMILMLWHWVNLIVKEMYPYIEKNPEFIDIIASPHYSLIGLSVSDAFKNPIIGTLNYCIQQISQNLMAGKDLNFENFKLQFEYREQKGMAILWRIQEHRQKIEEIREQQIEEIDYDILYFGKRIKSLENQWV